MRSLAWWRVAALAFALGCGGSSSGGPTGPIAPTRSIAVPLNTDALTGYGNTFALEFTDVSNNGSVAGFRATLQLYRWDAAYPKDLLDLGTVYLGVDTLYQRLSDIALSADRATVTLNFNEAPSGWVAVVDTSGPTPSSAVTVPLSFTIDRAVASGRWLLVAAANALTLVDLASPGFPAVKTFDMGTTATLLLAVSDGFLVFTNSGYGHVTPDPTAATYVATPSATLRGFRKGFFAGDRALVAGPSPFAGKARLARVGLAVPSAPTLDASLDIDGSYGQFAYDGAGTSVLAFPPSPGGPPSSSDTRVVVVRDAGGALSVAADRSITYMYPAGEGAMHVCGGTLYALSTGGIGFFPLP